MPLATYPDPSDVWCETTGPTDGHWHVQPGQQLGLCIDKSMVGLYSIASMTRVDTILYWNKAWFTLYDGREFDGTKTSAIVKFGLFLRGGFADAVVILYDKWGRWARTPYATWYPTADEEFYQYTFQLLGGNWIMEEGFDWRFIKTVGIEVSLQPEGQDTIMLIDDLHFSYYELVRPELTVNSVPQGKTFTIDGIAGLTPSEPYGLDPDVDYTISVDAVNFVEWGDGTTTPERIINLAEGEKRTITAYYSGYTPPTPGKAKLCCSALSNSEAVQAVVKERGVVLGSTPFCVDLEPGTYIVQAVYDSQVVGVPTLTLKADTTTSVQFEFPKAGIPIEYLIVGGVLILVVVVAVR